MGRPFLVLSDGTMTAPPSFPMGALIAHTGARAFAPRRVPPARGPLLLGDAQRDRRLGIAGREDQVFGDAAAQSVDWLGRSVHPRCARLAAGRRASMVDVDNPAWNGRALVKIVDTGKFVCGPRSERNFTARSIVLSFPLLVPFHFRFAHVGSFPLLKENEANPPLGTLRQVSTPREQAAGAGSRPP